MKKVKKYFYNTTTHRFEKLVVPFRVKFFRIFGLLSAVIVSALIIVAIAFQFLDSPKEKQLKLEMYQLREKYSLTQKQIKNLDQKIAALEDRDNDIYRAIFESSPLPDSIRYGKNYTETTPGKYAYFDSDELIAAIENDIQSINTRISYQEKSFDTLKELIKQKEKMLSRIPAIQPISNKELTRLASGFGQRIDPIYKTPKMHTGLDFTAPTGTPIHATADGVVSDFIKNDAGYGNHVIINHGYGYETLYAHMVRGKVKKGEKVVRGQVIGWVGSTGKSTGPHCHYEVIRYGNKINPVFFFFNDLTATEYDRLVKIAGANNQSFD